MIITLDGPAASGKSSAAKEIADGLNIAFVSSGLLYRAATYLTLKNKVSAEHEDEVLALLAKHKVELKAIAKEPNRIFIDDQDISRALHTDDVDANVSAVASLAALRDWVNERLREVEGSFVIEGRDMGKVVFPNAEHKFYLTASARVRAERRVAERDADLEAIEAAIKLRDEKDKKQLAPAEDAIYINTDGLSLAEVVVTVLEQIKTTD